jgi:hypothetical protein
LERSGGDDAHLLASGAHAVTITVKHAHSLPDESFNLGLGLPGAVVVAAKITEDLRRGHLQRKD